MKRLRVLTSGQVFCCPDGYKESMEASSNTNLQVCILEPTFMLVSAGHCYGRLG